MHETTLLAIAAMLAMTGLAASTVEQRVFARLVARREGGKTVKPGK
jgi:hypothetical protein